jgi:hypothetical protein
MQEDYMSYIKDKKIPIHVKFQNPYNKDHKNNIDTEKQGVQTRIVDRTKQW